MVKAKRKRKSNIQKPLAQLFKACASITETKRRGPKDARRGNGPNLNKAAIPRAGFQVQCQGNVLKLRFDTDGKDLKNKTRESKRRDVAFCQGIIRSRRRIKVSRATINDIAMGVTTNPHGSPSGRRAGRK